MSDHDDLCDAATIAELVRSGHESALDRIGRCYLDRMLGVGRCACRDADSARDAVQDALVAAAEHLDQFRGDGSVEAWLSRMVVNACRCNQRGRKNDPSWNRELDDADHRAHIEGPADEAARRQLAFALARAVDALSPADRQLFIATQVDGLSAPDAALLIGISPAAVRARTMRIRRRLRAHLADLWRGWSEPA